MEINSSGSLGPPTSKLGADKMSPSNSFSVFRKGSVQAVCIPEASKLHLQFKAFVICGKLSVRLATRGVSRHIVTALFHLFQADNL